jgi:hypothetical protein
MQLGGFAFIGEGIPIGLGAAFQIRYRRVRRSAGQHILSAANMSISYSVLSLGCSRCTGSSGR